MLNLFIHRVRAYIKLMEVVLRRHYLNHKRNIQLQAGLSSPRSNLTLSVPFCNTFCVKWHVYSKYCPMILRYISLCECVRCAEDTCLYTVSFKRQCTKSTEPTSIKAMTMITKQYENKSKDTLNTVWMKCRWDILPLRGVCNVRQCW